VPYWLGSDTFAVEDVWSELAAGKPDLEDRLQAAYCRLQAYASLTRTDGYLTAAKALLACRGRARVLELLCAPVLALPPLVHRKGDVCDCLDDEWRDGGYVYRIHGFLKRNPSRAENERQRAMKADAKDHRLRALVYERDGGCCRYCRSGPLPANMGRAKDRRKVRTYDHVDPDRPAAPDGTGYVLACDRCNSEKGHRTPEEAEMVLLDEPTEAERQAWLQRDLAVFDRPPDRSGTAPGPLRNRDPGAVADRDRAAVPGAVADAIADDETTGDVRPEQPETDGDGTPARSQKGDGPGRAAETPAIRGHPPPRSQPQAQPRRTGSEPDIYHRRSRASPAADFDWPAGSVPAEPRRHEEGPSP
jgi:hypothetical protein